MSPPAIVSPFSLLDGVIAVLLAHHIARLEGR
jgi:hypothetical protein